MKALILNFYTGQQNKPGGKRSEFWLKLLSPYYDTSVPEFSDLTPTNRKGKRLWALLTGEPAINHGAIERAGWLIESGNYDLVVLCVPSYETIMLLDKRRGDAKFIVDIRDGILFQSLFFPLETYRFKTWLKSMERKVENADLITTNVPALKRHYEKFYRRNVFCIFNKKHFHRQEPTSAERSGLVINYSGGLLASTRGQQIFNLLRAANIEGSERARNIGFRLIGRFNIFERFVYSNISKSISFEQEVDENTLLRTQKDNVVNLIVCTTERDLLPAKTFFYLGVRLPILVLGGSYSLRSVLAGVPGVYFVPDEVDRICDFFRSFEVSEFDAQNEVVLEDDRDRFISELHQIINSC